jgi:hypothetical protein
LAESGEELESIVWSHRWEIHPAPPGLRAWLVADDGRIEAKRPAFLAFQIREGSCRAYGAVRRFGASPKGELRFGEPPTDFTTQTAGEQVLVHQEVFAFLPEEAAVAEQMPWFQVGRQVFFDEDEARRMSQERRQLTGRVARDARAAAGGEDEDKESEPS